MTGSDGGQNLLPPRRPISDDAGTQDFLISLKEMAIKRARNVGYKDFGEKFNDRVLRALGFIMLEYLKERVQSTSILRNSAEMSFLDMRELEIPNTEDDLGSRLCPRRKRKWEGINDERYSCCKKQKTEGIGMWPICCDILFRHH